MEHVHKIGTVHRKIFFVIWSIRSTFGEKRKHKTLPLRDKRSLITRLDNGQTSWIGTSAITELKKKMSNGSASEASKNEYKNHPFYTATRQPKHPPPARFAELPLHLMEEHKRRNSTCGYQVSSMFHPSPSSTSILFETNWSENRWLNWGLPRKILGKSPPILEDTVWKRFNVSKIHYLNWYGSN